MTEAERAALRERIRSEVRGVTEEVRQSIRGELVQQEVVPPAGEGVPAPPAPPSPRISVAGQPRTETVVMVPPHESVPDVPPRAAELGMAFALMVVLCVVGYPLARAFGRRLELRAPAPAPLPPEASAQLQRIEHTVEAMAIEIERIAEAQRYLTKVQAERDRALGPRNS
jgi:hypothetical protein